MDDVLLIIIPSFKKLCLWDLISTLLVQLGVKMDELSSHCIFFLFFYYEFLMFTYKIEIKKKTQKN